MFFWKKDRGLINKNFEKFEAKTNNLSNKVKSLFDSIDALKSKLNETNHKILEQLSMRHRSAMMRVSKNEVKIDDILKYLETTPDYKKWLDKKPS